MGLKIYQGSDFIYEPAIVSRSVVVRKLLALKLWNAEFIPDYPVVNDLIIGILKSEELFLAIVKERDVKTDQSQKCFENRRRAWVMEWEHPRWVWKVKGISFSLESTQNSNRLIHLISSSETRVSLLTSENRN